MSEGMNKVFLFGNLGADPELRVTPGGQAVLKLRMATAESYLDKNNTRQERTEWHSVTVWGKRGEGLAKILSKGSRILVEGRISTSSYEKDGEKRYRTEVIATDVKLAGGSRAGASSDDDSDDAAPSASGGSRYGTSGHGANAKHTAPPDPDPNNGAEMDEIPF